MSATCNLSVFHLFSNAFKTTPTKKIFIILYISHWLDFHLFFLCLCSQVVVHILGDLCSLGKRQNPTFIQNILGSKVFCHFHSARLVDIQTFGEHKLNVFFYLSICSMPASFSTPCMKSYLGGGV